MTAGLRVGLVFGGRSVEHRVSVVSARTVASALEAAGHEVVPLGIAEDGCWLPAAAVEGALAGEADSLPALGASVRASVRHLLEAEVDVVFPVVHGSRGEDGTLQGLFEMLDLPYVGCGVLASAVAMDKLLAKRLMESVGVPVVPWASVRRSELAAGPAWRERATGLGPPYFVKPAAGGSSVGVSRVERPEDLAKAVELALDFDETALVERAVLGRELECAVLGAEPPETSVLGEIVPGNTFYDYADKYLQDTAGLVIPAPLPEDLAEEMRRLAAAAFRAVGGHGMARVDFLVDGEGGPFVNEINTLPGFTSISMYPKLWEATGVPLPRLVARLVELAVERHRSRQRLERSVRAWLAELERGAPPPRTPSE